MSENIEIKAIIPRIRYIANGVNTEFEFTFPIFKSSNMKVYIGDTLQTEGYSVNIYEDNAGGKVVFSTAPANNSIITLMRNLSIERTTDFQEGSALRANVLNQEFDYQLACIQEVADNINRTMVMPPYAVDTDVNFTLPPPAAGKAIVWASDGKNLENSTIAVNELESTLRGYKEVAEEKASIATSKADIATEQATLAITTVSSKLKTDGSNADNGIFENILDKAQSTSKQTIVGWGMPDLDTGVSVSASGFTSTKKQWLCILTGASNNQYFNIRVNNILISTIYSSSNTSNNTSSWYPLDVGDVVSFGGTSSYFECKTYDMKGL